MKKLIGIVLLVLSTLLLMVPVGQAKNVMVVNMWGTLIGLDEVREIPTGTWATVLWGWGCLTWDQVNDFLASTDYTWTIDGEPISDYEMEFLEAAGLKTVMFTCNWHPKQPGEYYLELTVTFNEDHYDGFETFTAGTVMLAPRTILVTPRELYPLDPPEEPM